VFESVTTWYEYSFKFCCCSPLISKCVKQNMMFRERWCRVESEKWLAFYRRTVYCNLCCENSPGPVSTAKTWGFRSQTRGNRYNLISKIFPTRTVRRMNVHEPVTRGRL
jgi:hypothetical protein